MSRIRNLYNAEAIFITSGVASGFMFSSGNSGINGLMQIHDVQSFSHDFAVNRQDVNVMGQLARKDSIIIDSPTVNVNFQYYPTDGANESKIGLSARGGVSCVSGILSRQTDPKNIFCLLAPEGSDAVGDTNTSAQGVYAFGNASISNITWNFAVGALPTCDVTWEALNVDYTTGSQNLDTPAVNLENGRPITGIRFSIPTATAGTGVGLISAVKPGDINIEMDNADATALGVYTSGANKVPIQSFSISIPLARESLNRLGSAFAYAKAETYPITPTVQVEAFATELKTSSLSDVLCNDAFTNFAVTCKAPNCEGTGATYLRFDIRRAKLDGQSFANAVGQNAETVSLNYSCTIGGSNDQTAGIFVSGINAF